MVETRIAPARYRAYRRTGVDERRARRGRERRHRRARLRLLLPFAVGALVLACAVGLVAPALAAIGLATTPVRDTAGVSTPVAAWRQGEVPTLYQTDPAWADLPYAGGTIGENGCGPTCMAMAYIALTGNQDMGPVETTALAERMGCTVDGMTSWSFMTEGARALGLTSEELSPYAEDVRDALAAGKVIICSMVPGDFTTTGHFIVIAGADDEGRLLVRDPNSAARTAKTWDVADVLAQCANLWSIGRG